MRVDTATLELLAGLRGLISEETGLRLMRLASAVPADRAIVEIGSFCGKSAAYLGVGSKLGAGAPVIAVDPWDLLGNVAGKHDFTALENQEAFNGARRLLGLEEQVIGLRAFSTDAAKWLEPPPVGLLYVDGSHVYEDVRADLEAWRRHLAPDAVVAFDDYGTKPNPGVRRYVDELVDAGAVAVFHVPTLAEVRL